jgi:hypothetical protein
MDFSVEQSRGSAVGTDTGHGLDEREASVQVAIA